MPVESALLIVALTIALGLALGSLSVRGIKLGVAGILFAGLAFGHFENFADCTFGKSRSSGSRKRLRVQFFCDLIVRAPSISQLDDLTSEELNPFACFCFAN
jgi:hypothetical protein